MKEYSAYHCTLIGLVMLSAASCSNSSTAVTDPQVQQLLQDEGVRPASSFAGDGIAAKRDLLPALFPEVNDIIAGGAAAAESALSQFQGTPSYENDDHLFLLAYALEQMNYADGAPVLYNFLQENITGEVPAALAAVTHALRRMFNLPLNDSATYLASEIEDTIESLRAVEGTRQPRERNAKFETCWREFVLTDGSGTPLTYPSGHAKAGQPVTVGGTILSGNTSIADSIAADERDRVNRGGGTYTDYTNPEFPGVTYQGEPTRTFNCAGFAFRQFNDGMKWNADPGAWFDALRAVGAIAQVTDDDDATAGDFVFYFGQGDLPAHVAEVESSTFLGGITVINADRWSGLFTADVDASYFFGASTFSQEFLGGLDERYQDRQIWRWTNGRPAFKVNTDRDPSNSCHGEDDDGDGFPETETCALNERCIDPELAGSTGDSAEPQYQIFLITNYGSMPGGYLTILLETAPEDPPLLSSYPGGGIDPELRAALSPFTADLFDTAEAAAASICGGFSEFWRPVLASFILAGTWNGTDYGVDGIFQSTCE